MALPPSLKFCIVAGKVDAPHTLDVFLDYVCPFSAKLTLAIDQVLKPLCDDGGKYDGKFKVIFRSQVQPWHASSTLTHEAALAVGRAFPDKFWGYTLELMKAQDRFFDIPTSTLTPLQTREKLVSLASSIIGESNVPSVKHLLDLKSTPNGGNAVTDDLKYTIKFSRQNGIHVSPTVLWDGIIFGDISSSWRKEQWEDFLAAKVGH